MRNALLALLLTACFPPLERPAALLDLDEDGVQGVDDCDDGDGSVFPGAVELCNGADDDCDGETDEDLPSAWYPDVDGDGVGADGVSPVVGCEAPEGFVANTGDCNDDDPDLRDPVVYFPDDDGDGFGDRSGGVSTCEPPEGWTLDDTDCDDSSADVSPLGIEVCDLNNVDEDCDGFADDEDPEGAQGLLSWQFDADGDGFGVGGRTDSCDAPDENYVPVEADVESDCDDTDPELNPETQWYQDADGDGYGSGEPVAGVVGCTGILDTAPRDGDCRPFLEESHPGAEEVCTESGLFRLDEDCDGLADDDDPEGAIGQVVYFGDRDGDGYGDDATAVRSCEPILDTEVGGDCDDNNPLANPAAEEVCDPLGVDEDCDGSANEEDPEGASAAVTVYVDADGDGWGEAGSVGTEVCTIPENTSPLTGDCDDTNPAVSPDSLWCPDGDGDGFGDYFSNCVNACESPEPTWVPNSLDCDDGVVDATPSSEWYVDQDGDGFGTDASLLVACEDPNGGQEVYVTESGDCEDADTTRYPGAPELQCQDGVVNDCLLADSVDLCLPEGLFALDTLPIHRLGGLTFGRLGTAVETISGGGGQPRLYASLPEGSRILALRYESSSEPLGSGGSVVGGVLQELGQRLARYGSSLLASGPSLGLVYRVPYFEGGTAAVEDAQVARFSAPPGVSLGEELLVADFDGDGEDDVLMCASASAGIPVTVFYLHFGEPVGEIDLAAPPSQVKQYVVEKTGLCDVLAIHPDADDDGAADLLIGGLEEGSVAVVSGAKILEGAANPFLAAITGGPVDAMATAISVGEQEGEVGVLVGFSSTGDGNGQVFASTPSLGPTMQPLLEGPQGFGSEVAGSMDLDGDGLNEVVVAREDTGLAYVFSGAQLGSGSVLDASDALTTLVAAQGESLRLFPNHLVDDDALPDLVVSSPDHRSGRGKLWVLRGAN